LGPQDTGSALARNVLVMACIAPDDRPEADHSTEISRFRELRGSKGKLECTWHPDHVDSGPRNAVCCEPLQSSVQQALRDDPVETTTRDGEGHPTPAALANEHTADVRNASSLAGARIPAGLGDPLARLTIPVGLAAGTSGS
jgi:hypothetical protein